MHCRNHDASGGAVARRTPGTRPFNGTDYGAPTACAIAPATALASGNGRATAEMSAPANDVSGNLTGTRVKQMAQLFRNVAQATRSRSWDAAIAAFPGT